MAMGFLVFTISTLTPLDNMGVMTMKMMSITSITSTMGVTLISDTGGRAFCSFIFYLSPLVRPGPPGALHASPVRSLRFSWLAQPHR